MGVVFGAAGTYLSFQTAADSSRGGGRPPWESRDPKLSSAELVDRLDQDANLKLSPQQRDQLLMIMEETRLRYREATSDWRAQISHVREESRQRIRAELKPDQMERFDKLIADHEARRHLEKNR